MLCSRARLAPVGLTSGVACADAGRARASTMETRASGTPGGTPQRQPGDDSRSPSYQTGGAGLVGGGGGGGVGNGAEGGDQPRPEGPILSLVPFPRFPPRRTATGGESALEALVDAAAGILAADS